MQWIKWDEGSKQWRKRRLLDWVPTPVTNRYASTGERLVSVLSRVEPNWIFVPATDNEDDLASADVAKHLEPVICEENRIDDVRKQVAKWLVYTGNAFLLSWAERQEPVLGQDMAMQSEGGLLAPPPPEYKLYTDVYSPFQLYANQSVETLEQQEKVLIVERRDVSWVNKTYNVKLVDGSGDDEGDYDSSDLGIHYLESIGYVSSDHGLHEFATSKDQTIPRVTVKRMLLRPNDRYPDGLYVVAAKGVILEQVPLPKTPEGKPIFPLVHLKFDDVPGAFFGRTPMYDLVQKQIQRNRLESLIELMTMRMASPIWVVPEGTVVKGWNVGEPGSVLRYALVGDKAQAPDRLPGEQIPNSLIVWLNKLDADFEELASTFEVLKGEAPFSGVPGVVVQQLLEQGMSRFGPAFRSIADGYRQWMKIQLELFRVYGTTPRMLRVMGENARWKISKFTQADLCGAVDVRIESESTVPRSEMVEAAKVLEAVNIGLIDILDPDVRRTVLKKLQLGDMIKSVDEQVLDAVKENEKMALGEEVPVKPFLDDHIVHIAKHKSFALSEEAQMEIMLPPEPMMDEMTGEPMLDGMTGQPVLGEPQTMKIQDIVMRHIVEHHMMLDAELMGPNGDPTKPQLGGGKPAGEGPGGALAPDPKGLEKGENASPMAPGGGV